MCLVVLGIDCAANARDVGIAVGRFERNELRVDHLARGSSQRSLADQIAEHLPPAGPALLALDAPLGWPAPLAAALRDHRAGLPILSDPNHVFRRKTDRAVRRAVGQQSLDVGADRIARTAHAALLLLHELREATGAPIALAWDPEVKDTSAIEVYPAATLRAHGIRYSGYKKKTNLAEREEILSALDEQLVLPADVRAAQDDDDVLDAVVCLLAAQDFLLREAAAPDNEILARREGWIWVRRPPA